jgi:Tfp pilus assembly protein PilN
MQKFKDLLSFNPYEKYMKKSSAFAVAISGNMLEVCFMQKSITGVEVTFSQSIPQAELYPPPEELSATVRMILSERGLREKEIILSVPDEWIFSRVIDFPDTVEGNLREVISYEMDRFTPFTSDKVFYDFALLEKTDGRLKVIMYLLDRDRLSPYLNRLRDEGINVRAVTFNQAAVAFSLSHSLHERNSIFMVLQQDGTTISLNHKFIPLTGEKVESDETKVVSQKISKIIEEGIEGFRPDEIVIYGRSNRITEHLRNTTSLATRDFHNLTFKGINLYGRSIVPSSFGASAMGVCRRPNINLLSSGIKDESRTPAGVTVFLLFLLLAVMVIHFALPFVKEKRYLEAYTVAALALKGDIQEIESLRKEKETLESKLTSIKEFKQSDSVMLEILNEVTRLTPEDTWLTRFEVKNSQVFWEGFSDSATKLIHILESSSFFKNVSFSSTTVKDRRMNKERFKIKGELEKRMI